MGISQGVGCAQRRKITMTREGGYCQREERVETVPIWNGFAWVMKKTAVLAGTARQKSCNLACARTTENNPFVVNSAHARKIFKDLVSHKNNYTII
jgi:hypothetical protein